MLNSCCSARTTVYLKTALALKATRDQLFVVRCILEQYCCFCFRLFVLNFASVTEPNIVLCIHLMCWKAFNLFFFPELRIAQFCPRL